MRRTFAILAAVLAAAALAGAGLAVATGGGSEPRAAGDNALLRSGAARYLAYLRAEASSLAGARRTGGRLAQRLHEGRLAPVGGSVPRTLDTVAAVRSAARLLSLDARNVATAGLLGVEARVAGAAVAFDAIRDALWARDKGLTGSIDERLAGLRAELDRHRRGARFRPAAALETADRRRLAAALDAYAWRLSLAAGRVGGS